MTSRVLLFTGKGGVGKTTLAAATAVRLAAAGDKTLVVSTDPAHSLGDAFGTTPRSEPSEVDVRLHAAQIDPRGLVDSAWQDLRARLSRALALAGVDELEAEELSVLPGVDEMLALTEVRRFVEAGRWDAVVVDCGPTAETLRLLALPEAIAGYVDRMFGNRQGGLLGSGRAAREAARSVRRMGAHLESLRDMLTDPEVTSVRLVLTPERVVVAEARRMLSSLALRGIAVDELIVNRLVPAPGWWRGAAASWVRARRRQQDAVLAELGGTLAVRMVEHWACEPVGVPALAEIAGELYGERHPLEAAAAREQLLRVESDDGGYRLRVALPLGRDAPVDLARVDDDLAITVDGFRRLIALPELLRPCRVTGAESDTDGLIVHFSPQEAAG